MPDFQPMPENGVASVLSLAANLHPTTAEPSPRPDGLLLVGHGTRHSAGLAEVRQAAAAVADRLPDWPVQLAFLELADPDIAQGLEQLAERGCRKVRVQPLLLLAAGHALRDIPQALDDFRARHPEVAVWQGPALESHRRIIELSVWRGAEALGAGPARSPTLLLMVGRGSMEPAANAEFYRLARLRFEAAPLDDLQVAFVAMTGPRLEASLTRASQSGFRRVLVQPHLLFAGDLYGQIVDLVKRQQANHPEIDFRVAGYLGPDRLLVDALVELSRQP